MASKYQFTPEEIDNALALAMQEGDKMLFSELVTHDGDIDAPEMKELRHELKNVTAAFGRKGIRGYLLHGTDGQHEQIIARLREDADAEVIPGHDTRQQRFESHVSRVLLKELGLEEEHRGR